MARVLSTSEPRARRIGFTVVIAMILTAMITSAMLGCSGRPTPRLAAISGLPLAETSNPALAPAPPTTTGTGTAPSTGGSRQTGPDANVSPPGIWQYAQDSGPMFGHAGAVYTFRVAVESGLPVSVPDFTAAVDSALGDYRSWTGGGALRMLRVGGGSGSSFTVLLAQPWTAYALCQNIGIDIRVNGVPFTNCQAGALIVINSTRYVGGVGGYGASLTVYRQYAINHEVGHRLGHGHVSCPGPGQLAPVMQQQTISLQGCIANAWPYPNAAPPPTPDPTPAPTIPPATTPPPSPTATAQPTTEP